MRSLGETSLLMKYKYIDIHAHVNFSEYDTDREAVIKDADQKGIIIINVGTDLETSNQVVALAEKYPNCYAIVGMHPTTANETDFDYEAFKKLAMHEKVVGIGECGLDYFREPFSKERQIAVFNDEIRLAIECKKPLMIHARNSYTDILTVLDQYLIRTDVELRGNVHFFAGSVMEAEEFIKRGFSVSYTGVVTFAKQYESLVVATPHDSIMSETDCPFVTPVPLRGQRNTPSNIPLIVAKMAEIKGLSEEALATAIRENAQRMFGIIFS